MSQDINFIYLIKTNILCVAVKKKVNDDLLHEVFML